MTKTPSDELSKVQIERRMTAALARALNTPHKPHKPLKAKKSAKTVPKPTKKA